MGRDYGLACVGANFEARFTGGRELKYFVSGCWFETGGVGGIHTVKATTAKSATTALMRVEGRMFGLFGVGWVCSGMLRMD